MAKSINIRNKIQKQWNQSESNKESEQELKKLFIRVNSSVFFKKIVEIPITSGQLDFSDEGDDIIICWVSASIFGGWSDPLTQLSRKFIIFDAPNWFFNLYYKYGKQIAKFLNKYWGFKFILFPLFFLFAWLGQFTRVK